MSSEVVGLFAELMLLPQFMVAHYWKANDANDTDKRTCNTNKNKFIYQPVHKKVTLQNLTNILI